MLVEVGMSRELHRQLYGYFPSDACAQQVRAGGFRPVVFFSHGLELALFTSVAIIAAIVIVRMKSRILRLPAGGVAAYLSGLLLLCKSLGPLLYTIAFAPVVMFTRPRSWVKIACVASILVCAYPLLREYELTPVQLISNMASAVSADRHASFETRVANEGQLLSKAPNWIIQPPSVIEIASSTNGRAKMFRSPMVAGLSNSAPSDGLAIFPSLGCSPWPSFELSGQWTTT